MALPDTRHRARYLFVAVMVGHLLLISTQVSSRSGVPLQVALVNATTEVQRRVWSGLSGVRAVWDGYVALRGVRADNERLAEEVADLRVHLQQERAAASTTEQLRKLLEMRALTPWKTMGAEVIGGSVQPDFRTLIIDRGLDAGIRRDMAVIAPAGVIGRVVLPVAYAATVQLLIDKNAAAAVMLAGSRAQGIALGNGDGTLRLEYLAASADVKHGDLVVTAGVDGIYPEGLVVGWVDHVERAGHIVTVQPAVDLSRIEMVLVIVDPAPSAATPTGRQGADGQARQ